jgi:gas vesicle protein
MFSRVRTAIRFFFVGLAAGVLLAPRSGEDTRRMLREKADNLLDGILDAATLGTGQDKTASNAKSAMKDTAKAAADTAEDVADVAADAADEATTKARGGNGSRTRSRSKSTAASEAGV